MAQNQISIIIRAEDKASSVIKGVSGQLDKTSATAEQQSTLVSRLSSNWSTFAGISVSSGIALTGLWGQVEHANESAQRLQSSLIGLNSVARAFHQDADAAKQAAQDLASDGLMTVADAATGLKNLLASGFSLEQAITLMKRFKDSAAFGRQGALDFGQAVSSATEGIKNGNSILVDNAGVTKNLSVILEEAGYSAQDLMKATTDAGVRQALFNGILKETNAQLGDADRLTKSAAGKQAQMSAETEKLYQQVGLALQPALLSLLQTVTPIIVGLADWISKNPELTTGIIIATASLLALSTMVGTVSTVITAAKVVALTFGPAVQGSVAIAQTAYAGFAALVSTALIMPAIVIAAAIAALVAVYDQAQKTKHAVDEAANAETSAANAEADLVRRARDTYRDPNATPSQKAWASKTLGLSGRAAGGPVMGGQSYLVGEHGPEMFTPASSGFVTKTEHINRGVTVNITGPVSLQDMYDIDRMAQRIDRAGQLSARGLAA